MGTRLTQSRFVRSFMIVDVDVVLKLKILLVQDKM